MEWVHKISYGNNHYLQWSVEDEMLNSACSQPLINADDAIAVMGTIAQGIHQNPDLEAVLAYTVDAVRPLLGSDRVLIYQFLPGGDGVISAESVGQGWQPVLGQLIGDPCFQERWIEPYRRGRISQVNDVANSHLDACHIDLLNQIQAKANLVVPILVKSQAPATAGEDLPQLWGLLVAYQCDGPRTWTETEVQVMKFVAGQLGIDLVQIQMHQIQQQWDALFNSLDDYLIVADTGGRILQVNQFLQRVELQSRALEACADVIIITDRQGTIEWVNPAFTTLTGYRPEEAIGKNPREIVKSNQQNAQFYRNLWHTILAGREWRGEIVNRRKDGSLYSEAMTITPVCDDQGKIAHFIAIKQDVTDRHAVEQHLRDRDAMLRKISEQVPGFIYQYRLYPDGHSCFPYASEAIRQIYEVTPEQVQDDAQPVLDRLHPNDFDGVVARIQESFQSLELWHDEYRVNLPERGMRWVEGHAMPEQLPDGSVLWHGYIRDITERKQLELSLQKSEALFRGLFEQAMVGISLVGKSGLFLQVNQRFCDLLGYTAAELYRKTFMELTHPEDREASLIYFQQIRQGQVSPTGIEKRYIRKDGTVWWASVAVSPIHSPCGELMYTFGVVVDISDRKAAEAQIRQEFHRERMVHMIDHHIRESLDLSTVLNTAVTEVHQFLNTDRVLIYRLNPDWSGVVVAESVAPGWLAILDMAIADSYFVETQGNSYHNNHINVVPDIYRVGFSDCHIGLLEWLQVRAKLVVPILQGDRQGIRTWGLLIAHQCSGPRNWQPFESEILQRLAGQLAIAIQQSELYQQVQDLNTHLETQVQERTAQLQKSLEFESLLKRITDRVRDSLDEDQIIQVAVEELADGLQVETCDAGIYNAEQTTSTIAYEFTHTLSSARGHTFLIADAPHPEVYPYLLRGESCQFCDIATSPLREGQRFLAVLACPLMDDQGVLGDLWLFKRSGDCFDELEVRLVEQVANQCAIALRQSRLYQAAQTQVQELERLNQLKDDFLSTISHELRTPMASIQMAVQLLEPMFQFDHTASDSSEREPSANPLPTGDLAIHGSDQLPLIQQYLQILQTESQREIGLINDLLELTRLKAGTEPINLCPIDLKFLLPHIAEPFIARTQQHQQQFLVELPDTLPMITTDLFYLERSLTELLQNACKYTPAGETIRLQARVHPTIVELQVNNSGVTIPAIECDRIFDQFYRIPNHDPWRYSGTGLGLALVKRMVERIGGEIMVSTPPNQVMFTIHLPRSESSEV
jgi:PAS domain S-box-containing protein